MENHYADYNKKWILVLSTLGIVLFLANVEMWHNLHVSEIMIGLLLVVFNSGFRYFKIVKTLDEKIDRYQIINFLIYISLFSTFFSKPRLLSGEGLLINWIVLLLINGFLLFLFLFHSKRKKSHSIC